MMPQSDHLTDHVRKVMLELMAVLWANGFETLHVGAAMRLLGVPDDTASAYDQEQLDLAENLRDYFKRLGIDIVDQAPQGTTLH
mgnify:CR=1 FL=1